ncbi:MAG: hypothetical protein MJE77_09460 [Proteobacteria bacterium]|nr:hypothetical protein [Pseudomonadota bacterium]
MSTKESEELVFNGIDGQTGEYLLPPMSQADIAEVAKGKPLSGAELKDLNAKARVASQANFAVAEGIDANDLAQAGWAVVFPAAEGGSTEAKKQAAIREALSPLLDRRRVQASRNNERYYREYDYRPGESKQKFLARLGAAPGPADPKKVPYYLLLVGSPEDIPFRVQYQVDIQYAVGRIYFDTLDEYDTYARAVIAAETLQVARVRKAVFLGVENPNDVATRLSHRYLVNPLADYAERDQGERGWAVDRVLRNQASADRLRGLLRDNPPAFLFTASHGVGFASGSEKQLPFQGALLCQDWGGPKSGGISREHYVAGEDIASDVDLRGMMGFHFACYGAGTPKSDQFARGRGQRGNAKAPYDFLSRLPQRMLGTAGAMAAIGHVDRAWGTSFLWADERGKGKKQLAVFESTVKSLLEGNRIGYAMEHFNVRYAELASDLTAVIEDIEYSDEEVSDRELAQMWIQSNDARNYAVIGDPAVRLAQPGDQPDLAGASETPHMPSIAIAGAGQNRPEKASAAQSPTEPENRSHYQTSQHKDKDVEMQVAPESESDAGMDSYGIFSRDKDGDDPGLLGRLANRVSETLGKAIADAMTLEVRTYVSRDVGSAVGQDSDLASSDHTQLRAYTRCKLDGDTDVCVPLQGDGDQVDEQLWSLHTEMVKQAQAHRAEMIKMVLSAVGGTLRRK